MELFRGHNLIEFSKRFKTDEDCKEYLAIIKWEKGYECVKCGYSFCQIRKDFSRTCTNVVTQKLFYTPFFIPQFSFS